MTAARQLSRPPKRRLKPEFFGFVRVSMNRLLFFLFLVTPFPVAVSGQMAKFVEPVPPASDPNQGTDIRMYGARSNPSAPTTCTTRAGSPIVLIRSPQAFINGSGIMCVGAGAPTTLATPATPKVTPSLAAAPMGTGKVIAGGAGATTYTYALVAEDYSGGLTAASTATTITNGSGSLGEQGVRIASWSRSDNLLKITTAEKHDLAPGAMAEIFGDRGIGNPFYCQVVAVPDNTQFTCSSNFDTRNGAASSGGNSGTVKWRTANHIVAPSQPNVLRFWIYGGSCGKNILCGWTLPPATLKGIAHDPLNLTWDDWGLGTAGVPPHPSWVPTSLATSSAKADNLITTIVSGGGTTTLRLATNAGTTVKDQPFRECADPGLIGAINSVQANAGAGSVYIPVAGMKTFSTCGVITVPFSLGTVIRVGGNLALGDTLICLKCQIYGDPPSAVREPSFGRKAYVNISSAGAPVMVWSIGQIVMRRLSFDLAGQGVGWLDDGPSNTAIPGWDVSELSFSSPTHDEYARHVVVRGNINGGGDLIAENVTFSISTGSGTNTPAFVMTGNNGPFTLKNWFADKRGVYFGNGMLAHINEFYCQGCITPKIMIDFDVSYGGGAGSIGVSLFNSIEDTSRAPQFAVLNPSSRGVVYSNTSTGVAGGYPLFTSQGVRVIFHTEAVGNPDVFPSAEKHLPAPDFCVEGILSTRVSDACAIEFQNLSTAFGPAYGWWVNAPPPPPFAVSVKSGGKIPSGPHTFSYAYVYPTSGGGFAVGSYTQAPAINLTDDHRSISFKTVPQAGAVGYSLSDNGFLVECAEPFQAGLEESITWDGSLDRCGQTQPKSSAGGPVSGSKDGLYAPKLVITSPEGFITSVTGSATARRHLTLPDSDGQLAISPKVIPFKSFIEGALCGNAAATSSWNLPTTAAPQVKCRAGSNVLEATLDFADGDSAQYQYLLPLDWDGASLDARILFFSPDTSGTVSFKVATACGAVDGKATDDLSFQKESLFDTVTLGPTANAQRTASVTGIVAAGCLAGNSLSLKISRGRDTAANRVRLKGFELTVRRTL